MPAGRPHCRRLDFAQPLQKGWHHHPCVICGGEVRIGPATLHQIAKVESTLSVEEGFHENAAGRKNVHGRCEVSGVVPACRDEAFGGEITALSLAMSDPTPSAAHTGRGATFAPPPAPLLVVRDEVAGVVLRYGHGLVAGNVRDDHPPPARDSHVLAREVSVAYPRLVQGDETPQDLIRDPGFLDRGEERSSHQPLRQHEVNVAPRQVNGPRRQPGPEVPDRVTGRPREEGQDVGVRPGVTHGVAYPPELRLLRRHGGEDPGLGESRSRRRPPRGGVGAARVFGAVFDHGRPHDQEGPGVGVADAVAAHRPAAPGEEGAFQYVVRQVSRHVRGEGVVRGHLG